MALSTKGYCKDWLYPDGSKTAGYDTKSVDAEGCMERCLALNPATTSFYLKRGKYCGCSETVQGACEVKGHGEYTSYQITPLAGKSGEEWFFG